MSRPTPQRKSGSLRAIGSDPPSSTARRRPAPRARPSPESPSQMDTGLLRELEMCGKIAGGNPEEASLPDIFMEHVAKGKTITTPRSAPIREKSQTAQGPVSREEAIWVDRDLDRRIRQRSQDLRIRQTDRKRAVDFVNHLRDNLMDFLKKCDQPFFNSASILNSGSYYEMVKINNPNEFDIMVTFPAPSRLKWTELAEYHGLFYAVSLFRPTRTHNIRAFLMEDGLTISASKMIGEMHRLVRKFISTYKVSGGGARWVVNRKSLTSPAVTLSLIGVEDGNDEIMSVDIVPALEVSEQQGWPWAARAGPDINNWLGKDTRRKLTNKAFYFVPKRPKGRNLSDVAKESWRISFSHIEKEIIRLHGNKRTCCEGSANKCCRKPCFRLLKCLIEGLKQRYPEELDPLCSYHGKTAFFHTLSVIGQDSCWSPSQLSVCFMRLLESFQGYVHTGRLPHFFVPSHNLFSPPTFPRRALKFLSSALEEQRELGLPLLQVPNPAPVLSSPAPTRNPLPVTSKDGGFERGSLTLAPLLSSPAPTRNPLPVTSKDGGFERGSLTVHGVLVVTVALFLCLFGLYMCAPQKG